MKLKNYMGLFVLSMFLTLFFLNISYINAVIVENEDNTHPYVFKCGETSYLDDATEPGRISEDGQELIERKYQSLFEGEQIKWDVLVMDLNGIENLNENQPVYVTNQDIDLSEYFNLVCLTKDQSVKKNEINTYTCEFDSCEVCLRNNYYPTHPGYCAGMTCEVYNENYPPRLNNEKTIEVNCIKNLNQVNFDSCNLHDLSGDFKMFNPSIMAYYTCVLTIETPESMYGQKWFTVEVKDKEENIGIMEEAERWFTNPVIGINVNDNIIFDRLRPGKTGYSNEISIKSSSDEGSGVIMDMFISGTDFSSSNETYYCPNKQTLGLDRIKYYAKNGIIDTSNLADSDIEGYRSINYGIGFNNPVPFYNYAEIIPKNNDPKLPMYFLANQMGTNDEIILKFKVDIPQQCKGNFNNGEVYIWGEAI